MTEQRIHSYLPLGQRLVTLLSYVLLLYGFHVLLTQEWMLDLSGPELWLVSAIAFLAYSLLDTPFFVPPRQALASGLTAGLLLLTTNLPRVSDPVQVLQVVRSVAVALAALTVAIATIAIVLHQSRQDSPWSRTAYNVSQRLGDGRILFTLAALLSIFGFHRESINEVLWLTFGWVILVLLRPIELAWTSFRDLRASKGGHPQGIVVGLISRIDSPNILRIAMSDSAGWERQKIHIACLPDRRQVLVIPLFKQAHAEGVLATGLIQGSIGEFLPRATPGMVYRPDPEETTALLAPTLSNPQSADDLVGFVVEESRIGGIRFEVVAESELEEGMLVFCRQRGRTVFYQILDARTSEESFERNPSGAHRATAAQLGSLDPDKGFVKYPWLPEMNTPLFVPGDEIRLEQEDDSGRFVLGHVPGTKVPVRAEFKDLLEYHTALLGVTGTGKTELAFDIIRYGLEHGAKVFCVDFTEEYRQRLVDLDPHMLGFDSEDMTNLEELIEGVETGEYSAAEEKRALNEWLRSTKPKIDQLVEDFLREEKGALGIFELPEIANTRATLRATELYLSAIFNWARRHRRARRILIVLEEAHTVIPEMTLFPRDRADTYAVVGRMAQIALQGRKYGVGLLLVSQRTALVSKSLLSQCNTVLAFAMYDKTGLDYLRTIYGEEHVSAIPNLGFLQGIAFGKAVLSDRPVLFKIPYREEKKKASEELQRGISPVEHEEAPDSLEPDDDDDDIPF